MAVELLVNLCPNDPYERRDRGFLLHQLDCTQVAIADYQYFIRKCPKDPATQLLQAQLQQLSEQVPDVFH
jgi:regulator of sirC expression with transglutaminase-like and TPR domain